MPMVILVFLLCCLLRVLQSFILHLGLRFILNYIFVKYLRSVSRFIFVHVNVHLFQHHFWKGRLFSIVLPMLFFSQRSVDCICVNLFLGSLFFSIDLFVSLFISTNHPVLVTVILQQVLKLGGYSLPVLLLSFNIVLAILGTLAPHISFRMNLFISTK